MDRRVIAKTAFELNRNIQDDCSGDLSMLGEDANGKGCSDCDYE